MILALLVASVAVLVHVALDLLHRRLRRNVRESIATNRDLLAQIDAALVEMRAEGDRFQAYRASQDRILRRNERLIALWAAVTGDPSSEEAVDARAAAADRARWN